MTPEEKPSPGETPQDRQTVRRHGFWATAAWCAGLAAVARVLWVLGRGPLAPPPLSGWSDLDQWLQERTPVTAAFALIRVVALAVVVYLLVLTLLALCAHLLHLPRLLRAVELSSIPAVRRALGTVAGVGLGATTTLVAITPTLGAPATRPPAAAAPLTTSSAPAHDDRLVIEQVRVGPVVLEEVRVPATTRRPARTSTPETIAPTAPPPPTTWIVRTGDHLWSIAQAHLSSALGRPVTDAETDPYWRALIEANRAALPDPANPDLIFTGIHLTLPAVPTSTDAAGTPTPPPAPPARSPASPRAGRSAGPVGDPANRPTEPRSAAAAVDHDAPRMRVDSPGAVGPRIRPGADVGTDAAPHIRPDPTSPSHPTIRPDDHAAPIADAPHIRSDDRARGDGVEPRIKPADDVQADEPRIRRSPLRDAVPPLIVQEVAPPPDDDP